MLPSICEATVERGPDRSAQYTEMRLLNDRGRLGYVFTALPKSCAHLRAGDDAPAIMPGAAPFLEIGMRGTRERWRRQSI